MISSPCPGQRIKRTIQAIAVLVVFSGLSSAASPKYPLRISLPAHVLSGQETTIVIESSTIDAVDIEIFDGAQVWNHHIDLKKGKGSMSMTFSKPGACMITARDSNDSNVVEYKAFVVEMKGELK